MKNDNQYLGLMLSLRLSVQMRSQAEEIATLYRAGVSQPEIAERLFSNIPYKAIVVSAIRKVLYGYEKYGEINAYEGAIPKDELEILEREHRSRTGNKVYANKSGIHSQTRDERSINGKIGGRISGPKALVDRLGIHSLSAENRQHNLRLSHLSRGITPWSEDEISLAYAYSQMPEYRRDFEDLAERLNQEKHRGENIRDAGKLKSALARYRTKLKINA